MDVQFEVIVIGAGPAGMAAALYASRAGLKVALIEKAAPGGKLVKTNEIQNYPGITQIGGADLAYQMYEHSTAFGAEYLYGDVVEVRDGAMKQVICADGTIYQAPYVIVATGTVERMLQIPHEEEMIGHGVSYCAVCDGAFFKDKVVTVIGGGNAALEEALYLAKFARKIYIVIRRDVFRAEAKIQNDIEKEAKIQVITKHVPKEIVVKDNKVVQLVLEHVDSKESMILDTDGIFPYIGSDPAIGFLKELPINAEKGYLIVDEHMETSVPGIYAVGDIRKKELRQVVTAVNDGAIAAQHIFHQYMNQ
ncbi:MAG: FAD-dependent oxidoreductase [Erysipelotrichaceae bacterium]|nr:FAD-dependent oxidoreductase [Erysipelotrichaceae bacterium]